MLASTDTDDTEELLTGLLRLRPNDPYIHYRLGNYFARKDRQFQRSVECYERVIELSPHFGDAFNALGLLLVGEARRAAVPAEARKEMVTRARDVFAQAIEATKVTGVVYFSAMKNLARVHRDLGSYAEAEALLRQLIEIDVNNSSAYWNLATLLIEWKVPALSGSDRARVVAEAVDLLQTAVRVDPLLSHAFVTLADVYESLMQPPNVALALAMLQAAADISPTPSLHLRIGSIFETLMKDFRRARECYVKAGRLPAAIAAIQRVDEVLKRRFLDPSVPFERTTFRCPAGHFLFRVHRKPFVGLGSWSCDRCYKALGGSEAADRGVLWCSRDCNADLCNACEDELLTRQGLESRERSNGDPSQAPSTTFMHSSIDPLRPHDAYAMSSLTEGLALDGTVRAREFFHEYRAAARESSSSAPKDVPVAVRVYPPDSAREMQVWGRIAECDKSVDAAVVRCFGAEASQTSVIVVTEWFDFTLPECGDLRQEFPAPVHERVALTILHQLLQQLRVLHATCRVAVVSHCDNADVSGRAAKLGSCVGLRCERTTSSDANLPISMACGKVPLIAKFSTWQHATLLAEDAGDSDLLFAQNVAACVTLVLGLVGDEHCLSNSARGILSLVSRPSFCALDAEALCQATLSNVADNDSECMDAFTVRFAAANDPSGAQVAALAKQYQKGKSMAFLAALRKFAPDSPVVWFLSHLSPLLPNHQQSPAEGVDRDEEDLSARLLQHLPEVRRILDSQVCALRRFLELFSQQQPWCSSLEDASATDEFQTCRQASAASTPIWTHDKRGVDAFRVDDVLSIMPLLAAVMGAFDVAAEGVAAGRSAPGPFALATLRIPTQLFLDLEESRLLVQYADHPLSPLGHVLHSRGSATCVTVRRLMRLRSDRALPVSAALHVADAVARALRLLHCNERGVTHGAIAPHSIVLAMRTLDERSRATSSDAAVIDGCVVHAVFIAPPTANPCEAIATDDVERSRAPERLRCALPPSAAMSAARSRSVRFLAPEVCAALDVTPASDVWSAACLALYLLQGDAMGAAVAFAGGSVSSAGAHGWVAPQVPQSLATVVPKFVAWLALALRPNASSRFSGFTSDNEHVWSAAFSIAQIDTQRYNPSAALSPAATGRSTQRDLANVELMQAVLAASAGNAETAFVIPTGNSMYQAASDCSSMMFTTPSSDFGAASAERNQEMLRDAVRAALFVEGVSLPTATEIATLIGPETQQWLQLFQERLTTAQVRRVVAALRERLLARRNESDLVTWIRKPIGEAEVNGGGGVSGPRVLMYVEGYGDLLMFHATMRLLRSTTTTTNTSTSSGGGCGGDRAGAAVAPGPSSAVARRLKKFQERRQRVFSSVDAVDEAPEKLDDNFAGFERCKFMLNHNNVRTGDDLVVGFRELALKDSEVKRVRLIVVHDNDLQVLPATKVLGLYYQNETSASMSTYYHRLRFGRAIENYFVPLTVPAAVALHAPEAAFWMCCEALATFGKAFFLSSAAALQAFGGGAQTAQQPLGEGWSAPGRIAGGGSDSFYAGSWEFERRMVGLLTPTVPACLLLMRLSSLLRQGCKLVADLHSSREPLVAVSRAIACTPLLAKGAASLRGLLHLFEGGSLERSEDFAVRREPNSGLTDGGVPLGDDSPQFLALLDARLDHFFHHRKHDGTSAAPPPRTEQQHAPLQMSFVGVDVARDSGCDMHEYTAFVTHRVDALIAEAFEKLTSGGGAKASSSPETIRASLRKSCVDKAGFIFRNFQQALLDRGGIEIRLPELLCLVGTLMAAPSTTRVEPAHGGDESIVVLDTLRRACAVLLLSFQEGYFSLATPIFPSAGTLLIAPQQAANATPGKKSCEHLSGFSLHLARPECPTNATRRLFSLPSGCGCSGLVIGGLVHSDSPGDFLPELPHGDDGSEQVENCDNGAHPQITRDNWRRATPPAKVAATARCLCCGCLVREHCGTAFLADADAAAWRAFLAFASFSWDSHPFLVLARGERCLGEKRALVFDASGATPAPPPEDDDEEYRDVLMLHEAVLAPRLLVGAGDNETSDTAVRALFPTALTPTELAALDSSIAEAVRSTQNALDLIRRDELVALNNAVLKAEGRASGGASAPATSGEGPGPKEAKKKAGTKAKSSAPT